MHAVAERIHAAAAIYKQNYRERQGVLAEMSDRLLHAVFGKRERFLVHVAGDAPGLLLQHLRVEHDEVNRQLDGVRLIAADRRGYGRRITAQRGPRQRRAIKWYIGRVLVCALPDGRASALLRTACRRRGLRRD